MRKDGALNFLLSDHLGSSSITTNADGGLTASALYKAFGETRYTLGSLNTDYKFTGQREEASLGIYFFQSRWYDGSLGRFLSPDSIIPTSTQGTQAWDRYAYVNNNPVRYNDPTGHQMTQGDGGGATCGGYGQPPCGGSGGGSSSPLNPAHLDDPMPPYRITSVGNTVYSAGCGIPFRESPSPNQPVTCTSTSVYSLSHDQADQFENYVYVHALQGSTTHPSETLLSLAMDIMEISIPGLDAFQEFEDYGTATEGLTFGDMIFNAKSGVQPIIVVVTQNMYLLSGNDYISGDGMLGFTATNPGRVSDTTYFAVGSSNYASGYLAASSGSANTWIQFLNYLVR